MQTFYNECLEDLNIASLECSCHHKGHLIKHGFYTRKIKTPDGIIPLKIQRFKCKHCHHTHAFLLSVIIPYSQILLRAGRGLPYPVSRRGLGWGWAQSNTRKHLGASERQNQETVAWSFRQHAGAGEGLQVLS